MSVLEIKLIEINAVLAQHPLLLFWIQVADFCKSSPKRLFAIPCLAVYDIDVAIKEMQRCNDMGMLGGLVWQVPHPDLPLTSDHYEKLWAAAAELGQPVHFHILTGFNYFRFKRVGMERCAAQSTPRPTIS